MKSLHIIVILSFISDFTALDCGHNNQPYYLHYGNKIYHLKHYNYYQWNHCRPTSLISVSVNSSNNFILSSFLSVFFFQTNIRRCETFTLTCFDWQLQSSSEACSLICPNVLTVYIRVLFCSIRRREGHVGFHIIKQDSSICFKQCRLVTSS